MQPCLPKRAFAVAIFAMLLVPEPVSLAVSTETDVSIDTGTKEIQLTNATPDVGDGESFCQKAAGGEVPGISFKFFDRAWSYPEWEASKQRLLAKCQNWNRNKQGSQAISDLVNERNLFTQLSLKAPDKMVDSAIQRLGPARNQGDTGNCFANAVADVATYHAGTPVSALSVAIRYYQSANLLESVSNSIFAAGGFYANGGEPKPSMKAILQKSVCVDDQRRFQSFKNSDLAALWDAYDKFRRYIGPQAPTDLQGMIQQQVMKIAPSLSTQDFMNHLSRYKSLNVALGEWFDRQCNVSLRDANSLQVIAQKSGVLQAVDDALSGKEIAVVTYDSRILQGTKPSVFSRVYQLYGHTSLIIGKATIEGVTYYLLRNSWGTDCTIYSAVMQKRCKLGHIWITEDEAKNIFEVEYYGHSN